MSDDREACGRLGRLGRLLIGRSPTDPEDQVIQGNFGHPVRVLLTKYLDNLAI